MALVNVQKTWKRMGNNASVQEDESSTGVIAFVQVTKFLSMVPANVQYLHKSLIRAISHANVHLNKVSTSLIMNVVAPKIDLIFIQDANAA